MVKINLFGALAYEDPCPWKRPFFSVEVLGSITVWGIIGGIVYFIFEYISGWIILSGIGIWFLILYLRGAKERRKHHG